MMSFRAFGDDRLDANIAIILHLSGTVAVAAPIAAKPASTFHAIRGSRRASVTVMAAFAIALCGIVVALFAERGAPPAGVSGAAITYDTRQVIDLGATPVIRRSTYSPAVLTSAPSTIVHTRRMARRKPRTRVASVSDQPIIIEDTPSASWSSPPSQEITLTAAELPGANESRSKLSPVPQMETSEPSPTATSDMKALDRDRRDSVSAIRSLRRQW